MLQCGALKRYSSKVIYDNYNFAVVYIISISCIKIPLAPRTILKLVQLHYTYNTFQLMWEKQCHKPPI